MLRRALLASLLLLAGTGPAFAHSAARGFVLLLPVSYVIAGGALAVLVSFLAVSTLPERLFARPAGTSTPVESPSPSPVTIVTSIVSAALIVLLIVAGWAGPHDPAENLLPLGVWTLWWVIIVLLHPLFGNLWAALNPFTGLHALLRVRAPPLAYPQGLSYWPALFIFLAFAWFQLVYRSPEDPDTLAMVVSVYLVATLVAVLLFGPAQWLGRADPFAVFFSQLGAAAPIGAGGARPPGLGLLTLSPML